MIVGTKAALTEEQLLDRREKGQHGLKYTPIMKILKIWKL